MGTTKKRRSWTAWEDDYLRNEYPERSNADLAQWLHRSPPTSPTYRPIGHEKVYADGYVWVITEHGRKQKHRWVWEQANGPIPEGYCVKFKDGNRMNCSLDNLYLVSRADHARETRAALSPEQKKEIMRKAHDGRRASIRRDKLRLKWGLEPEGKLVKRLR